MTVEMNVCKRCDETFTRDPQDVTRRIGDDQFCDSCIDYLAIEVTRDNEIEFSFYGKRVGSWSGIPAAIVEAGHRFLLEERKDRIVREAYQRGFRDGVAGTYPAEHGGRTEFSPG